MPSDIKLGQNKLGRGLFVLVRVMRVDRLSLAKVTIHEFTRITRTKPQDEIDF
jgi:hypothetical protein